MAQRRTFGILSAALALCAVALALAGCRHPCGYAGVRSVIVPDGAADSASPLPGGETLRVAKPASAEDLSLVAVAERQEITINTGRRDTYGYRTYVPYTWYAPLLKPVAAVTLIVPGWMSARDPHTHNGRNWRRWDYFRDFIAWFNIFSGVPTGPRKIEAEQRLIRSKQGVLMIEQRGVPASGRTVVLLLDDKEVARAVSGDDGSARFDLAPYIAADTAGAGLSFNLKLQREDGTEAGLDYLLDKETAAAWLKAHPAP